MPIDIRTYEALDEDTVASLWTSVFAYSGARNVPAVSIARKLEFQPELFFVAVCGEKVVGTVMGGYDGHRGWIYSLAVPPEHRSKGIGRRLVAHVEGALKALSCGKINLQVVTGNEGVVGFYEKLGYVVEPRISMGKVLGEQ